MAPEMIAVYKTSHRTKARAELKRAGIKPYTPKEFGGLIAANDKPLGARYVHGLIGDVPRKEYARLYGRGGRTTATKRIHKFNSGDKVISRSGYPGIVTRVLRGNRYDVEAIIANKTCVVKMRESDISLLHPHTK